MVYDMKTAAIAKQRKLEEEINRSGASPREKANMLHTLSKMGQFWSTHADELETSLKSARRAEPRRLGEVF